MTTRYLMLLLLFCCYPGAQTFARPDTVSVHFATGDSRLSASAARALDSVMYRGDISERHALQLIGHADEIGDAGSNLRLSRKRAEAVQQHLHQSGFPADRITLVTAKGEQRARKTPDAAGNPADRRVDVTIAGRGAAAPATAINKESRMLSNTDIRSVAIGQTITLDNINFQGGSAIVLKESIEPLKALLRAMQSAPGVCIRIEGHVCCRELHRNAQEEAQGRTLSVARARTIYDYLVKQGVAAERLEYKGFGSGVPLVSPEMSETDRVNNRRVEIRIIP